MSDDLRRCDIQRMTPAELAIHEAILAVERLPADVRLTDAVVLLSRARSRVADYVDGRAPPAEWPAWADQPRGVNGQIIAGDTGGMK